MTDPYDPLYHRKQKHLRNYVARGHGPVSEADAEAIRELVDAFDENSPTTNLPRWPDAPANITGYREDRTLANWLYYLTEYAQEIELTDTTARELNGVAEDWLQGTASTKEGSISKGTIRQYQNACRIFYRYHEDLGVDFEDIAVYEANDTTIQPRDILTPEEIARVRDAPDHSRDQAVVDLLLYTGMRNTALRKLRIKDIDIENQQFYFNSDADGLKNIHRPNEPRPLLGAVASVREWLDYHPYSDDPEAYFIVGKPKWQDVDPTTPVNSRTIQRIMDTVKEEAHIDKPLHPHACRHNYVFLCIREYDMEPSTVKFLIGHGPDSQVMETTYQHLSAEDYNEKAMVKAEVKDPEEDEQSSLTPDFCDVCGEPLGPKDVACSRCGTDYTPNSQAVREKIEEAIHESAKDAETEEAEEVDLIREIADEHPEVLANAVDAEALRSALDEG